MTVLRGSVVQQCARQQCAALRAAMCSSAAVSASVCGSVRQLAAVCAAVCGSARGSVSLLFMFNDTFVFKCIRLNLNRVRFECT